MELTSLYSGVPRAGITHDCDSCCGMMPHTGKAFVCTTRSSLRIESSSLSCFLMAW